MNLLLVFVFTCVCISSSISQRLPRPPRPPRPPRTPQFPGTGQSSFLSPSAVMQHWTQFKMRHNRTYSNSSEEHHRLTIFKANLIEILRINGLFTSKRSPFRVETNVFSDMTLSEVSELVAGAVVPENDESVCECVASATSVDDASVTPDTSNKPNSSPTVSDTKDSEMPVHVDWRDTDGAVSPVKDQGSCGSCWAFSAVAAMESQLFLQKGRNETLSEQHLVDCTHFESSKYKNKGCKGGWMDTAFRYVKESGGIGPDSSYPYAEKVNECRAGEKDRTIAARVKGFVSISKSEDELMKTIAKHGPVSAALSMGSSFVYYKEGVHYDENCDGNSLHAVLIVGFGTDPKSGWDYWLVKNSWGTWWGEQGYVRMARNRNNNCEIANFVSYPLML